jgi:hypothetical protein
VGDQDDNAAPWNHGILGYDVAILHLGSKVKEKDTGNRMLHFSLHYEDVILRRILGL